VIRRGEAGFTLVELLVATALLGMLTILVFGGVKTALRTWAKTHDGVAEATDLWAVESLLRRTIAAADPLVTSPHGNDHVIDFEGESAALSLLAHLPQAIAPGITARMRFFLLPDGQSQALMMAWRANLPAAASGAMLREDKVKLLDRVRAIHFDYFGPSDWRGAVVWQLSWTDRTRLANLIRIRLERDDPAAPNWPELVAEPRADLTTGCLYDAVSGDCRRIQ
jgi:general secretion pathway protein J